MNKEKITATTLVEKEKETVLSFVRPVISRNINDDKFSFPIIIHCCYDEGIGKLINKSGSKIILSYINEFLVEYKDDNYELYAEYVSGSTMNFIHINYKK